MRRKSIAVWIAALALGSLAAAAEVTEREDIHRSLSFRAESGRELVVDNIFGSIAITGTGGDTVKMHARKTIKARNPDKLERARNEVVLDIREDGNSIELYVDGPFRWEDENGRHIRWRNPGYTVTYDFEIEVPRRTDIYLKTVNQGDIEATGIEGSFDVRNVNGKIRLDGIGGSGRAHTVNGGVRVNFTRNPEEDCSFKTVNGDLNVRFMKGLSAEFRLKTFNGDMYSDFPVEYLAREAAESVRKNGKFVYKSSRFIGVRTGEGGPRIQMDTFNGDILIRDDR